MSTIATDEKLALFQGMLVCAGGPRLSCYDGRFRRIFGDDENFRTGDELLSLCRQGVDLEAFLMESPEPVLFTGRIGLYWILCPLVSMDQLIRVYALGPCLSEDCSSFSLDAVLTNAGASLPLRAQASVLLRSLPVLPFDRFREYAAMLYYLVSEERLKPQDVRMLNGGSLPTSVRKAAQPDDLQTYAAEQELLRRVQSGDVSLSSETDRTALMDSVIRTRPLGDQLRQMKNDVLSRLVLLSRAAIAGGIGPENGYSLYDKYAQSIEATCSGPELVELLHVMQDDFAGRVHSIRTRTTSQEIETACDYIDQHLEGSLTIKTLSSMSGYTEYYFSRKFKRETGMSPAEYIRKKRLERAAVLLRTTEQDVKQIGFSLQFCSHSFFSDCFRRQYGVTPSQYRKTATS